jgi:NhaP-type Na+/H+ or K+/H+ antiporter
MFPEDPNDERPTYLGLTVGVIGAAIISIGFILDTIAQGIELSEIKRKDEIDRKAGGRNMEQLNQIQRKLDFLLNEVDELKRRG